MPPQKSEPSPLLRQPVDEPVPCEPVEDRLRWQHDQRKNQFDALGEEDGHRGAVPGVSQTSRVVSNKMSK